MLTHPRSSSRAGPFRRPGPFLTRELKTYQRRIPNNLDNLKKHVRYGDVVLVEGKTRISQVIKYMTQSSWSHSGIYIGDRVVGGATRCAIAFCELHGDEARYLVLEADLASGVWAAPLSKYKEYNIRICRPYCLAEADRDRVLEEVIAHVGDRYDRRQLFDLGRYLTPFQLLPARWRRKAFFSGESESRSVICSGLIAQAFLGVGYPIMPVLPASMREEQQEGLYPWGPADAQRASPPGAAPRLRPLAVLPHRQVQLGGGGPDRLPSIEWVEPAGPGLVR